MNKSILIKLISLTLSLTFIIYGFAGCKSKSDTSSNNDSMVDASSSEDEYKLPEGQVLSGKAQSITVDDRVLNSGSGVGMFLQFFDVCLDMSQPIGEFMEAFKNSKFIHSTTYMPEAYSRNDDYADFFIVTVFDEGIGDYIYRFKTYQPFNSNKIAAKDYYFRTIELVNIGSTSEEQNSYASKFKYQNGSDMRYDFIFGPGGITNGTTVDKFFNGILQSGYFNGGIDTTAKQSSDLYNFNCTHNKVGFNFKYDIPGAVLHGRGSESYMVYDMVVDTDEHIIYDARVRYEY